MSEWFFIWRKNTRGELSYETINTLYLQRFEEVGGPVLKKFELVEADMSLTLDKLAIKYPFNKTKLIRDVVVVDIDHVLGDPTHRHGFMDDGWDSYHSRANEDVPNQDLVELLNNLDDVRLVAVTSRPEKWRQISMKWLIDHSIFVNDLLMRADNNFDKAIDCKINLLKSYCKLDEVLMVIDTDDRIIEEFSKLNISTMQFKSRRISNG